MQKHPAFVYLLSLKKSDVFGTFWPAWRNWSHAAQPWTNGSSSGRAQSLAQNKKPTSSNDLQAAKVSARLWESQDITSRHTINIADENGLLCCKLLVLLAFCRYKLLYEQALREQSATRGFAHEDREKEQGKAARRPKKKSCPKEQITREWNKIFFCF